MKKIALITALLVAGLALAAQQIDLNVSTRLSGFVGGLLVVPANLITTDTVINGHRVTKLLGTSSTVDVASTATLQCSDSAAITLIGAKTGDPCLVGLPATHPTNGSGSFSCVVSAADAIKLRFCNPSAGALDPSSATFFYRVISSQ
jgi:hypothetical protein